MSKTTSKTKIVPMHPNSKYTIESINANKPKDCRLTAISFNGYIGQGHKLVLCICECGKEGNKRIDHLVSGLSLSCGCLRDDRSKKAHTKYFPVIEGIYNSWKSMMRRCYNEKYIHFKYYGGRGVAVCIEWHNYQIFLDWSLANGWQEGFEIDKDIKGTGNIYSPDNCMWVSSNINKTHKKRKLYGSKN